MSSTAKKFAGQTAVYGVSTIAQRLLSSLLTPLYTSVYRPSVYSIFSTMFSYASLLQAILAFGMETTFFRYLNKFADNKKQVYNNGFWVIFLFSIIFLSLTLPFTSSIAAFIKIGNDTSKQEFEIYIKYFIGILILDAWCVIPFAKLRADGRPVRYGTIKLVNIIVTVLLNLIFIFGIPYAIRHHLPGAAWFKQWYVPGWIAYVFWRILIASVVTLFMLLPEFLKLRFVFDGKMLRDMLSL